MVTNSCLFLCLPGVVILLGYTLNCLFFQPWQKRELVSDKKTTLSKEGKLLFKKFDRNGDRFISPDEFIDISELMLSFSNGDLNEEVTEDEYDPEIDEVVKLKAEMEPLILQSLSQTDKNDDFGKDGFAYAPDFVGLLKWKKVNIPKQEFLARDFVGFLPRKGIRIGEPYWIMPKSVEIKSNPYRPAVPISGLDKLLHKILVMLHPRPFVMMRFPPQGGVAVVRAQNKIYMDIQFRFHSEFQLNEFPRLPFWFTPSQFGGHVIVSRDGRHIREFSVAVPNDRKLNVDMEWESEISDDNDNNMEVDIGYIPLLSVKQTQPSSPVVLNNGNGAIIDRRELWKKGEDVVLEFDQIVWDENISEAEAKKELEVAFYPFKQIDYLPFSDVFKRAEAEKKLVHQVILWGALDDQSC